MTNGNATSGGTALVNRSSTTTSAGLGNHRALRSATKKNAEAEEVALMNAEEKMMDEEITSVEDNQDESMERTMMTVALVKSVVETKYRGDGGDKAGGSERKSCDNDAKKGSRYGLRKRRRPSGQDLERLEHFQSTSDGGLARTSPREPPVKNCSSGSAPPPGQGPVRSAPSQSVTTKREAKPRSLVKQRVVPLPNPLGRLQAPSSVPNPLSVVVMHPGDPALRQAPAKNSSTGLSSSVPCPLPSSTQEKKPAAVPGNTEAVSGSADKRKVTINESASSDVRVRGFSIDMDCEYLSK